MAEEEYDNAKRRQQKAERPHPVAGRDPAGQGPYGHADPEKVVHQSDEKDIVVEQGNGEQRQHRPAADQRAVEHQDAGNDEREHRDDVRLAGKIDIHHSRQRRHDEVHRQIWNDLPIDLIELRKLRVLR